jgi:hypothetical protein
VQSGVVSSSAAHGGAEMRVLEWVSIMSTVLITCDGHQLPFSYRWLVEQGLTRFGPWYFIEEQSQSDMFRREFAKEVADPNPAEVKDFQPFAKHAAYDDLAGFVIRDGRVTTEVLFVHLTFKGRAERPGWPNMTLYDDVWTWFADCVVEDMRLVTERLEASQHSKPER